MTNLQSLFVLVTRPGHAGKLLTQQIQMAGGQAIHFPTLAFQSLTEIAAFHTSLGIMNQQDWLIFISPEAVRMSLAAIQKRWPSLIETIQLAAIGKSTAQLLEKLTCKPVIFPKKNWNTESLLALPPFQSLSKQKIMLIKGEGGRETLRNELINRGNIVSELISYKRILPKIAKKNHIHLIKLLNQSKINFIIASSVESLINLRDLLDETIWPTLITVPLMVMSERIKILAEHLGFQTIWVAENGDYINTLSTLV